MFLCGYKNQSELLDFYRAWNAAKKHVAVVSKHIYEVANLIFKRFLQLEQHSIFTMFLLLFLEFSC